MTAPARPADTPAPVAPHAARALFDLPEGCVYLDTAAYGPRLRALLAAGHAALDATRTPWLPDAAQAEMRLERVRALAAGCFDDDPEGVALLPSAAHGIATAARNVAVPRHGAVLVLEGQFPSNLLAWQQRCAEVDGRIAVARRQPGQDWTGAVLERLQVDHDIAVAALPHAYWHDGALLDLDRIAPAVHDVGAALVLDLSQSLGALPVDLARWRPDFVVAVAHKWLLGPFGLAWLWAAPRWRAQGLPIEQHWSARDGEAVWRFTAARLPPYRPGARRFDAGGAADPMRLAMAEAAFLQLQAWGPQAVLAGLRQRTDALDAALAEAGLAAWCAPGHAAHFTGLRPPPATLDTVHAALQAAGIVCTKRHGLLRVAPHLHVDTGELVQAVAVAARAAHGAWRGTVN